MRWLVALVLAFGAAPMATASCAIHLEVQGRQPFFTPPPTLGASGGACASAPVVGQVDDHVLLSGTDALMVHFHFDYGPSVPTISGTLDGLGLANAPVTLDRVPEPIGGGYHYALADWLPLPSPATTSGATLTASAMGETSTYTVRP